MVSFRSKKIQTEYSLGEKFEAQRKSQYISIEKAAAVLRISKDYLKFLEMGEYEKLPGEIYVKNFIKVYGKFLGFHPHELLDLYKRERTVQRNIHSIEKYKIKEPPKIISRLHLLSAPRIVRNVAISLIVCICLLYIGFKVEAIIRPPELEIYYPSSDVLVYERYIEVKGKTDPEAHVFINGQSVLIQEGGNFSEKINLNNGINEIKILSKKDHSKENIYIRRIVVQDEE